MRCHMTVQLIYTTSKFSILLIFWNISLILGVVNKSHCILQNSKIIEVVIFQLVFWVP